MTTRLKHLHATLPPDVLDKFLRNIREHKRVLADEFLQTGVGSQSMRDIIGSAFLWSYTPEGFEYWDEIARQPWEPQPITVGDTNAQIAETYNAEVSQAPKPTRTHPAIPHQLNDIVEILMFAFPDDELLHPLMNRFDPDYYPIETNDDIKDLAEKHTGDAARNIIRDKFVSNAFLWDATPEGFEFWSEFKLTGAYNWDLAKTKPETIITLDPSQLPPAPQPTEQPLSPGKGMFDLSDMHKQIFIGKVISGVGSEFAIGCADSAVEEYRKYLKDLK